jgi:predicted permease
VHVYEYDRSQAVPRAGSASYPDFVDFKVQNRSFSDLAGYGIGTYNISDDVSAPERMEGSRVTSNLFSLIGLRPRLGRDFMLDDGRTGAEPVVLISHGLWQTRYAGAANIIGRNLRLNAVPHTIVGVMPEGMKFPINSDIWLPLAPAVPEDRGARGGFEVIGRLQDAITIAQARSDLQQLAARLRNDYPTTNKETDATVIPFADRFGNPNNAVVLTALFGAVAFVLLIACANLAGLILTRAIQRMRETAIRMAVGASRWQVVRQSLTETVILALLGGVLGLVIAAPAVRMIAGEFAGVGLPYWIDFSIDYAVILQLVAVCFFTGIVFGIAPALKVARADLYEHLKTAASGSSGLTRKSRRLLSVLITAEIAMTLVLLVGAGLMIRSFLGFQLSDIGIPAENFLTARLTLTAPKYPDEDGRVRFAEQLLERLRATSGLESVTIASHAPMTGGFLRTVRIDGADFKSITTLVVAPGYFAALGSGIIRGRDFSRTDGTPGNAAVIVNERFAARHWPGQDAVGKRFQFGEADRSFMVVGVSRDLYANVEPTVFVPYRQEPGNLIVLMTQNTRAREAVVKALRTGVQELDADLPLFNIRTVDEYLWRLSVGNRVLGALFTFFAVVALVMSMLGLYGVTAYSVIQRTHEIGIRMALGATRDSVLWLFARRGILYSAIGLVLGVAGSWAISRVILSRVLSGLPGRVPATDAVTFVVAPFLLALMTLIACLSPARRAAKSDPAAALRNQ